MGNSVAGFFYDRENGYMRKRFGWLDDLADGYGALYPVYADGIHTENEYFEDIESAIDFAMNYDGIVAIAYLGRPALQGAVYEIPELIDFINYDLYLATN